METTAEKILVTGALGQIGTELTSKLVEIHGKENVIASGIEKWREGNTAAGWYERIDVTNYKLLEDFIKEQKIAKNMLKLLIFSIFNVLQAKTIVYLHTHGSLTLP